MGAHRHAPPRLALWLLDRYLPEHEREFLIGDLVEVFGASLDAGTPLATARRRFWSEAALALARRNRDPEATPFMRYAMADLSLDFTLALRRLARAPGFTLAASLTLALGIGAACAIVVVARPAFWGALPFRDEAQIVTLRETFGDGSRGRVGFTTVGDLAERVPAFAAVAAAANHFATLTTPDGALRLTGLRANASWFEVFGVHPRLGRAFHPSEDRPGGARVVVLTHALWQRHFSSDSGIVGRTIQLTGNDFQVVGVLPPTYESVLAPGAEYLIPLRYADTLGQACRDCRHLEVVARLKPRVTIDDAQQQVDGAFEAIRLAWPAVYGQNRMSVTGLRAQLVEKVRGPLLALIGAAGLLVMIALANTTNLFVARSIQRRGEVTIRTALGASRWRLARSLLIEALLVSGLSALFGLALAHSAVGSLVALAPESLPRLDQVRLDGFTMVLAAGLALVLGMVSGLVPTVVTRTRPLRGELTGGARTIARGGHDAVRRGLVILEMAMALLLLGGAGILVRSVQRLLSVDIGFSSANRTAMALGVGGPRFREDGVVFNTWQRVHESVRAIPGVMSASLTSQLPLSSDFDAYGLHWEGSEGAATTEDTDAFRFAVTPDYATTMGLSVRQGRFFAPGDTRQAPPVVVINEGLARRMGIERSPLGRRVRIGGADTPWRTVVGVVNDVQHPTLDADADGQVYLPLDQNAFADGHVRLVTRSTLPAAAITPAVRAAVAGIDPDISIAEVRSLDEVVAHSARQRLFARLLFQVFSLAAVLLSAIGIFGVMSGMVNERTREIGVRSALGATQSRIMREFLGQGAALAAVGIVLGLGGALVLASALRPLVFGISPRDPVTLAGVSAGLAFVALVATWWPARRAARMDAVTALRSD